MGLFECTGKGLTRKLQHIRVTFYYYGVQKTTWIMIHQIHDPLVCSIK